MNILETAVASLVGAVSALLIVLVKDVILDGLRERRRERRQLLDRRLTQLYAPLWVATHGGGQMVTEIIVDREINTKLASNFHLLSPRLQALVTELFSLVDKKGRGKLPDAERVLQLHREFTTELASEIEKLRAAYVGTKGI